MKKSLSISEWHEFAGEGKAPPMRIKLNGYSMNPIIRGYRDYVTVIPAEKESKVGDIVLFCEPNTERYVMHRIWIIEKDRFLTWGDNCSKPDGWISQNDIWGKVVLIERGKWRIYPDPNRGRRWAFLWHRIGWIYRFNNRIMTGLRHKIRKHR